MMMVSAGDATVMKPTPEPSAYRELRPIRTMGGPIV
jgi:hypothetical protein